MVCHELECFFCNVGCIVVWFLFCVHLLFDFDDSALIPIYLLLIWCGLGVISKDLAVIVVELWWYGVDTIKSFRNDLAWSLLDFLWCGVFLFDLCLLVQLLLGFDWALIPIDLLLSWHGCWGCFQWLGGELCWQFMIWYWFRLICPWCGVAVGWFSMIWHWFLLIFDDMALIPWN